MLEEKEQRIILDVLQKEMSNRLLILKKQKSQTDKNIEYTYSVEPLEKAIQSFKNTLTNNNN